MQSLTQVFYNRQEKQYIVRNGQEIARFPAGPANKILAQWAAIAHDAPSVLESAKAIAADLGQADDLTGRLLRAARLVVAGHVRPGRAAGAYRVLSQTTEGQVYDVGERSLVGQHCDCWDYEAGREARFSDRRSAAPTVGGQTFCKHILAVQIVARMKAAADQVAQQKAQDWQDQLAERQARDVALPASVDETGSIEDYLGYPEGLLCSEPVNVTAKYAHYKNDGLTVAEQKAAARASLPGADPLNRAGGHYRNINNPNRYSR